MMSTQPRSVSPAPPKFGEARPTAHVTNHTTLGQSLTDNQTEFSDESSAKDLLRNVKADDDLENVRKRSGALRVFGRRSSSFYEVAPSDNGSQGNKHYIKMGIMMSDDVTSTVTQSLTTESNPSRTKLKHSHTLSTSSSLTVTDNYVIPDGAHPASRRRTDSDGFEFVDAVHTDEDGACIVVQPSPPISVKSGSSNNTIPGGEELQTSSPDSGYGNTPDYINGGGSRPTESAEIRGQSPNRASQQRTSADSSNQARLSEGDEARVRGDTDNSVDSGEASPGPNMPSERPALKHAQSVPNNLIGLDSVSAVPEQGAPFPFRMSMAPAQGTSLRGTETVMSSFASTTDFRDMEKQLQQRAHDHVNPSQPTPHQRFKVQAERSPHSHRRWLETSRRKGRASSQPFAKSADVLSVRSLKSGTLPTPTPDTKDYFQVTDELSKETSHFSLSEALLSVIEQYKANCVEQAFEDIPLSPPSTPPTHSHASSDVSQWQGSPCALTPLGGEHYLESPVGSYGGRYMYLESPSGSISSMGSISSVATSEDMTESLRRPVQLSLLELMQSPSWDNSAESTAQKLLRHMTGHMTKSQGDATQVVVQVPTDFLTSLQTDEDLKKSVTTSSAHIRGNREWAPPRNQIIYSIKQPSRNLQKDLSNQGYRCTGCGMKVDPTYAKYFRFCNYTGKYFCQNCHMNATSIIPAHILDRWSFKRLYVSNFARDLLNKIYSEPVFAIANSNSSIYNKVPLMAQAKELRGQLISVKQYLNTCRNAQHLNLSFQGYAPWTTDLHAYSIEDFVEIKSGTKMKYLRAMLADGIAHIKSCPLCEGKGFVCEMCGNDHDVIFPFELNKVSTCKECKCCFHKSCYSPTTPCPRCLRVQQRLKQRAEREGGGSKRQENDYSNRPS